MEEIDRSQMKEFSNKIIEMLNNSMLGLMLSIGHRLKLFETLSDIPPSSCYEVSRISGLNERYLQEWLNAMVVGKIMNYDPQSKLYSLPKEHSMVITKRAGYKNLAKYFQWIQPLASIQDMLIDSFTNGGGVGYDKYPGFLKILSEITDTKYDSLLIDTILPLIPDTILKLEKGVKVLDIGCGVGHSTNLISSNFPQSAITGYDISEQGIETAIDESQKLGLTNVNFHVKNLERMEESNKYSLITAFDIIHDLAKPHVVLKSVFRALKDDGTFLMVDIKASSNVEDNMQHPGGPLFYSVSTMHCMTVSLAEGGVGLGTMWGRQKALELLDDAGFKNVEVNEIQEDVFNYYYIAKKN